jgi:phage-related protein
MGGFGKILSKVTSVVSTVSSFISNPISAITKPLTGLVDKLADKLPFGLGKLVKPFADKFLGMGVSWLMGGPLGGLTSMLGKIAPTVGKISDVLNTVNGAVNGGKGLTSLAGPALQNAQNIFANQHAQALLA